MDANLFENGGKQIRFRGCSVDGRKRYENDKCWRKSFWKLSKTAPFSFENRLLWTGPKFYFAAENDVLIPVSTCTFTSTSSSLSSWLHCLSSVISVIWCQWVSNFCFSLWERLTLANEGDRNREFAIWMFWNNLVDVLLNKYSFRLYSPKYRRRTLIACVANQIATLFYQ